MLPTLLPLCLSFAAACPQGQAPVTELLPLQHLVGVHLGAEAPPWGSLLHRPGEGESLDLLEAGEPRASLQAEDVLQMLRDLQSDAVENGRLHLDVLGPALLAIGEAAEVAKTRERLQKSSPVLTRMLQIEFAVWDATDRETPTGMMTAAEFGRVFANLTPLSRCVTASRHGQAVVLERMRWTRYVRDLDAQVAQKVNLSLPVTAQFGEGAHAVVRAYGLCASDEFAVYVQFAVAQRRGVVRTLQTGIPGAADLELPLLETDYGAMSGRIGNGGALAATLRGHAASGGHHIVTVRVLSKTPPSNHVQDGLGIFPCGALTGSEFLARVPPEDARRNGAGVEPGPGPAQIDCERLLDFVRTNLGGDAEHASLSCGGGFLFARAPAPVLARIDGLVRGLQDRFVRGATVRHAGTLEPADASGGGSAPLLHELVAPTLVGRQLTLARCLETNIVAEVQSAIAQEASMLDPGIELLQSGCWLSARLQPQDELMYLQLQVQNHHAATPQARSALPGGVLMTPEVARSLAGHDGAVANGQAIEHGDGPAVTVDNRSYRSSLGTTVRW